MESLAEETLPLYQCYSRVRIRGDLDKVDVALDKIMKVVNVENRLHAMTESGDVQVETIASASGLDLEETKSKVSPNDIRMYLSLTKQTLSGAEVLFLGCSETTLKR